MKPQKHKIYYIANIIQEKTSLPEDRAINVGTGFGEYGDPGPQYAIDLHDETVRQKTAQPLPYDLLRQLCMGDAPPEERYDLDSDPWAVNNLVDDPATAETLARMRDEMKCWREFTADRDVHPRTIPAAPPSRVSTSPLGLPAVAPAPAIMFSYFGEPNDK